MFKKSACPFGQVQTKMYLPKSPFFKNSLAWASGQVLMLMPVVTYRNSLIAVSSATIKLLGNSEIKEISPGKDEWSPHIARLLELAIGHLETLMFYSLQ